MRQTDTSLLIKAYIKRQITAVEQEHATTKDELDRARLEGMRTAFYDVLAQLHGLGVQ